MLLPSKHLYNGASVEMPIHRLLSYSNGGIEVAIIKKTFSVSIMAPNSTRDVGSNFSRLITFEKC